MKTKRMKLILREEASVLGEKVVCPRRHVEQRSGRTCRTSEYEGLPVNNS